MFETIKLASKKKWEIPLATRLGNRIENELPPPPDQTTLVAHRRISEAFKEWKERAALAVGYNCAGHVWASRRTAIYEPSEWNKILTDDFYDDVDPNDVREGDLVIYYDKESFLHVGEIIAVDTIQGFRISSSAPIPKILSKWDQYSGEYIHSLRDVPFKKAFPDFQTRFVTERGRPEVDQNESSS